jgi:Holliday junction resolvase RusA-like endonuclease
MITLQFPDFKPCAKARPRVTRNGTYMPKDYQEWRDRFAWQARLELADFDCRGTATEPDPMTGRLSVSVEYRTASGNMRPDLDNALGAVLDALQPATISNDGNVRELHGKVVKAKRQDCGITVTIEALP